MKDGRSLARLSNRTTLRRQRQPGLGPANNALTQLLGVIALSRKRFGGHSRAIAPAAVEDNGPILIDLIRPISKLSQRQVLRALNPAHLPLMLSPHINQLRTRINKLLSLFAGNLRNLRRLFTHRTGI